MQNRQAITEAAKLRAHKDTYVNSFWWAVGTGLFFFPCLGFLPFPHVITCADLLLFFISMAIAYCHRGKPKTTLNKTQLKLFVINDATVVTVDGSSANNLKATTSESTSSVTSSSTTLLRHRAINTKQQLSSPSPSASSHIYRSEAVATGFTPNTEPRNFDVFNSQSYAETSWREVSEAVDRRNNAGNAGSSRYIPHRPSHLLCLKSFVSWPRVMNTMCSLPSNYSLPLIYPSTLR